MPPPILLASLAILFFGLGFTTRWLFAVAIFMTRLWPISLFAGGAGGHSRGYGR